MPAETSSLLKEQKQQSGGLMGDWSVKNISSTELAGISQMGQAAASSFAGALQQFGTAAEASFQSSALGMQIEQMRSMAMPDISAAAEFQKSELRDSAASTIAAIRVQAARSGMVVGQGSYGEGEAFTMRTAERNMRTVDENARRAMAQAELQIGNAEAQRAINDSRATVANVMGWIGVAGGVLQAVGSVAMAGAGGMGGSTGAAAGGGATGSASAGASSSAAPAAAAAV